MSNPVRNVTKYTLDYWRRGLTPGGRLLFIGALFAGLVGSTGASLLVQALFCSLVSFFAVAFVSGHVLRPRVTIRGELPPKISAASRTGASTAPTATPGRRPTPR